MAIVDQMVEAIRRMVAKALFGKSFSDYEDIDINYNVEDEVLLITLRRLVFEGKINQAENMLFEKIKDGIVDKKEYIIN